MAKEILEPEERRMRSLAEIKALSDRSVNKAKAWSYGQLVVDFGNAETIDEAYFGLIDGIRQAFDFSSEFVEEARGEFTFDSRLEPSLNKSERALFDLMVERNRIISILHDEFFKVRRVLVGHDCTKQTLTFVEGTPRGWTTTYEVNLGEITDEEWKQMKPSMQGEVKRLFEIENRILESKNKVSKKRLDSMKFWSKLHPRILFEETKERLIDLLNGDKVPTTWIHDGSGLRSFPNEEYEERFLGDLETGKGWRKAIAYFLCQFLVHHDQRLIKQCSFCHKFHIRRRRKEQQNYFCPQGKCKDLFWAAEKKKRIWGGEEDEPYMTPYMRERRKQWKL